MITQEEVAYATPDIERETFERPAEFEERIIDLHIARQEYGKDRQRIRAATENALELFSGLDRTMALDVLTFLSRDVDSEQYLDRAFNIMQDVRSGRASKTPGKGISPYEPYFRQVLAQLGVHHHDFF